MIEKWEGLTYQGQWRENEEVKWPTYMERKIKGPKWNWKGAFLETIFVSTMHLEIEYGLG